MQTIDAKATQVPPPGFTPKTHDVIPETFVCPPTVCKHGFAPNASAPWPNNNSTVQVWLFDIEKDPTESNNLAPTRPVILRQVISAFEAYQHGAVDDISCKWGGDQNPTVDPASDPFLRADKTWGPFTGSKLCKWV